MVQRTRYHHGTPSWLDLCVPDPAAAAAFYGAVFGWEAPEGDPEFGGYRVATLDGSSVAGIMAQMPEQAGQPGAWSQYLAVDDAEQALKMAEAAGATVVAPVMAVGAEGRMALLRDPTGAFVGLWEAGRHTGAQRVNEAGAFTWSELLTGDPDRAAQFYTDAFGLVAEPMEGAPVGTDYRLLKVGDDIVAGLMAMPPAMPAGTPPHWAVYFGCDDADATAAAAEQHGGRVLMAPVDTPHGRMARLMDPAGAAFVAITVAGTTA